MNRPFRHPGERCRIAVAAAVLAAGAAAAIAQPAGAATDALAVQASSARATAAAGSCYPKTEFYLANTGFSGDGWQTACGYVWFNTFPAQLVAVQDVSRPLERIWLHYFPPGGDTLQAACIFSGQTFKVPSSWQVHDLLVSQNHHPCWYPRTVFTLVDFSPVRSGTWQPPLRDRPAR